MSKEKEIVAINGQVYPISKCRKFDKGYYLIGQNNVEHSGDCYLIEGKYYRAETGQIVFDHEILSYSIKNDNLIHGIVKFDENKDPILGYFSKTPKNIILGLENNGKVYLQSLDLIKDQKQYRERLSDGCFYHINTIPAAKFNQIVIPSNEYKTSLPYDSGGVLKNYIQIYENSKVEINKNVASVAPLLEKLSFGLEFETIAGYIPERILNTTGLIPLRDGSISGIEYVTVPMTGEKGLQVVMNGIKELNYRTKYDNSCALHMHVGNIPRTPEFILAMFKTTCAIQDEMYTMFPLYKKYNFGVKNKNYSQPYDTYKLISQLDPIITKSNINNNFDVLYSHLSMGEPFGDHKFNLHNVMTHPADRENRAKWNIKTRYYLNNFIPLIFGNKQTIEFRIHTATLDSNKIMYFMLINSMIINFVIENSQHILENPKFLIQNGDLLSILRNQIYNSSIKSKNYKDYFYSKIADYVQLRKNIILYENKKGNILGNEDKIIVNKPIDWINIDINEEIVTDEIVEDKIKTFYRNFDLEKARISSDHKNHRVSTTEALNKISHLERKLATDIESMRTFKTELV